jgi:hypothetical protein
MHLLKQALETLVRLQIVPRLALGLAAGLVGGSIIYLAGWSLADEMIEKTKSALVRAFKPDLKDMIYAQTMAESLAASQSPAGGAVQVQVLALAQSVNEQAYFNASLTVHVTQALTIAWQNACIERLVLARGREKLFASPPSATPPCTPVPLSSDLATLRVTHQEAENQYQALLSELATAHASAQFDGDPRAEVTAALLSRKATIASLNEVQLALNEALLMIEVNVAAGFETMRNSAVGSQSDLASLRDLLSRLEYLAPTTQAWHRLHGDVLAQDARWIDMKVAAGDSTHDLVVAIAETSTEYRNLGGVEGSLRTYVEEEKANNGAGLAKAEEAVANKYEALGSGIEHTRKLDAILRSTSSLIGTRVVVETNALATLLFGMQIWHLTWGVLGGLVGALLGELLVRVRNMISRRWVHSPADRSEETPPRAYADAIFPLIGLMLAMVVSVRLADSLDGLTDTLIAPLAGMAITGWWGYLVAVLILGLAGTVIGGLCGRFLLPSSSRNTVVHTNIWITGVGGVLAGVVAAIALRWLVGPHDAGTAASDIAAAEAHLFALALIGGLFGSLIGATLIAGGGSRDEHIES